MGFFDGLGSSLVSGVLGAAGSIGGGVIAAQNAKEVAQMNIDAQREFAQNSIRWKVDDAKAAGIHPLYSLGSSPASFTPVQGYTGDYGISDAVNQFSQGISRAAQAKMTKKERDELAVRQALDDAARLEDFKQRGERHRAELNLINSEIARNMAASKAALAKTTQVPAMPRVGGTDSIPGQGDKTLDFGGNAFEVYQDIDGKHAIQPTQDFNNAYEDKFLLEYWPNYAAWKAERALKSGKVVNGYVWDGSRERIVRADSDIGRRILSARRAADAKKMSGYKQYPWMYYK